VGGPDLGAEDDAVAAADADAVMAAVTAAGLGMPIVTPSGLGMPVGAGAVTAAGLGMPMGAGAFPFPDPPPPPPPSDLHVAGANSALVAALAWGARARCGRCTGPPDR
jgi:hypothetical protein